MTDDDREPKLSLDELGDRIARGRQGAGLDPVPYRRGHSGNAGDGLRISVDFVVATLVGAGLGYGIGLLLGGKVIGLVIGMFIGFAAGIRGMARTAARMTEAGKNEDPDADGRNDD